MFANFRKRFVMGGGVRLSRLFPAVVLWCAVAAAQAPVDDSSEEGGSPDSTATTTSQMARRIDEAPQGGKIELKETEGGATGLEAAPLEKIPQVTPPLSLYECGLLMQDAIRALEHGKEPLSEKGRAVYVDRIVYSVIGYVDLLDRSYPTLPYYEWQLVAAEKVPPGEWDTMVLRPRTPMANITAVSMRVRHGDVNIRRVEVIDKDKTRWEFTRKIHIISDQNRPEVFFLPLPTELAEIRIDCQRVDRSHPRRPRLYVNAGQCEVPEWAKQAIFRMRVARDNLRDGKPGQAAAGLRQAYTLLERFQKDREF